jgi:glyoxylase-like metal-dependent hydrolase (beta-lactamase superfamily II)
MKPSVSLLREARLVDLLQSCTLVASGDLGFGLTDPYDGHAYLVGDDDTAVIIDAGCGRATDAVALNVERALRGRRLAAILLTHAHVDHSGGAAELADRFGAPVHAHPRAAERIAAGDERAIGLEAGRRDAVYPADTILRPLSGIRAATDLDLDGLVVHALPSPGHSDDSVVWSVALPTGLALFTGDVVFTQGRVAVLDTADTDVVSLERSIRDLRDLEPEHLFPGHGAVAIGRGRIHLDAAVAAFDAGRLPQGLVA